MSVYGSCLVCVPNKLTAINKIRLPFVSAHIRQSQKGDRRLNQPFTHVMALINYPEPADCCTVCADYLRSHHLSSQTGQTPAYKFRYDSGRVPPLAFPLGRTCQSALPPRLCPGTFPI